MANKFIGETGLVYLWGKIKAWVSNYAKITYTNQKPTITIGSNSVDPVLREEGKGLSTNDYTTEEKTKLSGIAAGAEVNQNAFSNVKVGSDTIAADGKTDTLEIAGGGDITVTGDTSTDKVTISATFPTAESTVPLMDGTASAGTSATFSRGDHVHPSDTSKANASDLKIETVTGSPDKKKITLKSGVSQEVLISHQDISGKANTSEMSVTSSGDTTTIQLKEGTSATVINTHQDISGKADKSNTVSTVTYDPTGKKITKTINSVTSDVVTAAKLVEDGGGITSHQTVTDKNPTLDWNTTSTVATIGSTDIKVTMPADPNTDTKNTAGSTANATKLYLIGAETQAANPQTYSQANAYITAGKVYSNAVEVVNLSDSQTLTNKSLTSPTFTGTPTAPTATSGTNTTQVATTAFVMTEIQNSQIGAATFQGTVSQGSDISGLTTYKKGWYWVVDTAGKYCNEDCEPGDMIFCVQDFNTSYKASDFSIIQRNIDIAEITTSEMDELTNNWT